jgi:hypothetical protein
MLHIDWLWQVLNWMSLPALAVVAGILVWRKVHREFPFFFWFLIVTIIAGALRFVAQFRSAQAYYYVYWVSDLIINIFIFLAVYELFIRRLFPQFHKVRFYRYLFPVIASGIILVGWLTALEAPDKTAAFLFEDRVLDSILVAILAFFVSLMLLMGREWTKYDFGIAWGLGINAAAFLIASSILVRRRYHPTVIDQLPLIAFDVSCLIWLITFWQPERRVELPRAEQLDREMLHQARNWEVILKDWLTTGKSKR